MTFDELKLCAAIYKADLGGQDRPRGDSRREAAGLVMATYVVLFDSSRFPYSIDEIESWRLAIRKSANTKTKIQVALTHGFGCFWVGRGVGSCCDNAECGHIVPRCRGGEMTVENSFIECREHNNSRRERLIEEYLAARGLPQGITQWPG